MVIKGCRSIAEYAFRQWMQDRKFVPGLFELEVCGNMGTIRDLNGNTLTLVYDAEWKEVHVE